MAFTRSVVLSAAAVISFHNLPAWGGEPVRPTDLVESVAFLEAYRSASASRDLDFYDLYSDRALVHVRANPQGPDVVFDGRAYKRWGRELLEAGRISLDGSAFREATVEQRGGRLTIRAKRYSTTHCYWDDGYQMSIEREGGSYRILDERLALNLQSHCRESAPLMAASPMASVPLLPSIGTSPDLAAQAAWHPLSEAELAEQALRMAQQIAVAQVPAPASEQLDANQGIAGAPPVMVRNGEFITPPERAQGPASFRVIPQDAP